MCVAVCYSVLQLVQFRVRETAGAAPAAPELLRGSVLQRIAACCSNMCGRVLQCVAVN